MISYDEVVRYILMLREEAMGNNEKLNDSQIMLNTKIMNAMKNDINLKNKIDKMLNAGSISEMYMIWNGREIKKNKEEISVSSNEDVIFDLNKTEIDEINKLIDEQNPFPSEIDGGNGKAYTLSSKHGGFIDTMIMALATGFVSGMLFSIFILIMS